MLVYLIGPRAAHTHAHTHHTHTHTHTPHTHIHTHTHTHAHTLTHIHTHIHTRTHTRPHTHTHTTHTHTHTHTHIQTHTHTHTQTHTHTHTEKPPSICITFIGDKSARNETENQNTEQRTRNGGKIIQNIVQVPVIPHKQTNRQTDEQTIDTQQIAHFFWGKKYPAYVSQLR